MKYIRTQDGKVFAFEIKNETDLDDEFIFTNALIAKSKKESFEIFKIADTIEELCDAFVSVDKDNNRICHLWSELDRLLVFERGHDTYFYGAIWTDKGLIYVAKMNAEGELELL